MADFDPDAYLSNFDPDAYLKTGQQPYGESVWPRAFTEMHEEGKKSFMESLRGIGEGFGAQQGTFDPIGGPLKTGQGILSAVGLPLSYPAGAARSLVGHPMASALEATGKYIVDPIVRYFGREPAPQPSHEEIFGKISPDIDLALSAAGTRGPAGSAVVMRPPRQGPIVNELRLATEEGRNLRAGQLLEEAANDPDALRTALNNPAPAIVSGSKPTTFQLTGDMGVGQLERAAATRHPDQFLERRAEQNVVRVSALEDVQRTGSPQDVADNLRAQLRAVDRETETATRQAEFRAWQEAHELGGANDPQIYGNVFRRELQMAEEAMRARERGLWQAIDPEGRFSAETFPIKRLFERIYESMGAAMRTTITDGEKKLANLISGYEDMVPFRELTDLRSAVTKEMREERMRNGSTPAYARLVQFRVALEDAIVNHVMDADTGRWTREAAERLRVASEATRTRAQRFNAPPLKEILRREGFEGPYRMQEGAVAGKIIAPGPTGADNVSAFLRAVTPKEGLPVVTDAAVASMRRAALNPDGTINQGRLARWMERHQDMLRVVDEHDGGAFSQSLRNAGDASQAMADAAARRSMVLDEHQRGIFGRIINADPEDLPKVIGSIFSGNNPVANARSLARRLTTEDARDGARRAIVDYVREKFLSNVEAGTTEENLIKANQFQEFIKKYGPALEQFFSSDQVASWRAIVDDIRRSNRSVQATKLPGGSNTPQDLYNLEATRLGNSLLTRMVVRAAGTALGAISGGGIDFIRAMAGLAGAHFGLQLRDAGVRKVQDVLRMALLDPILARQLLQRAAPRAYVPRLKYYSMYQAAGAGQGEE